MRTESRDLAVLAIVAAIVCAVHLPVLDRYGFHRDELYFLSCGARLDWGYFDHPPFVPWMAAVSRWIGDSLFALRLLPCLAGGLTVFLSGVICRELGGRRFAQVLTALAVAIAPFFTRTANGLTIPSFEPVFWLGCAWILLRIVRGADPRWWLGFGLVAGVGLLNKHTMLLFGAAVVVGLVLTPARRAMATRWFWLGGTVAFAVFLPNLIWQIANDWPTLQFIQRLRESRIASIGRGEFLAGQVIYAGPTNVVLWAAGVWHLIRRHDPLGWVFVTIVAVLCLMQSKVYYSLAIYPVAIAAGAVLWESRLARRGRVLLGSFTALGLAFLPLSLPLVPIERVDDVAEALTLGLVENSHEVTGDFHDMFGWREFAEAVGSRLDDLEPEQRADAVVLVRNYGQAGALEHFARGEQLPPIVCNHLSWHLWTRRWLAEHRDAGAVAFVVGVDRRVAERYYADVFALESIPGHPEGARGERNLPVWLCQQRRAPLAELWPKSAR